MGRERRGFKKIMQCYRKYFKELRCLDPTSYKLWLGVRGFSLVEVMVAIVILSSVAVIVSMGLSGNLLRVRQSRLKHHVADLLERKAVEIETKHKGKSLDKVVDESGDFGKEFKRYRWEFKVEKFEMPDLGPLLISRKEGAEDFLLTVIKQMTDFISKSVKEGTLAVFVKVNKKKEAKYSITMYFVDFDQPLSLGGGL